MIVSKLTLRQVYFKIRILRVLLLLTFTNPEIAVNIDMALGLRQSLF